MNLPIGIHKGYIVDSDNIPTDSPYNDLFRACKGLLEYRKHNDINFQLEKADDYIVQIRIAIQRLEEIK